jgi:uncharacterized protein (DUF1697 family)
MATHVALLRGINVGGGNKVPMAELRQVVAALGHQDVTTYIQSGNVLFSTQSPDTAMLASGLEQAIEQAFGIRAGVIVVSRAELAQVISDNPYPDEPDPKAVHAVFLAAEPSAARKEAVAEAQRAAATAGSRDTATHVGRVLYLHTPDGYGRSELAARLSRSSGRLPPGEAGTARNWATVTKLLALFGD